MTRAAPETLTARHRVREIIEKRILNGRYPAGTRLRQIQLAKELGVAQSVIRESLQELSYHGLVESIDNLGVFVRSLDAEQLIGAYQVREMFEGLAARLCCETASRGDLSELESLAEAIHAGHRLSLPERGALEQRFHMRFVELSRNQTLQRLSQGYRFLGNLVHTDRDRDEIRREHLAIVRAVADNQPDRAEQLAREHVARSRHAVEEASAKGRFEATWVILPPESA